MFWDKRASRQSAPSSSSCPLEKSPEEFSHQSMDNPEEAQRVSNEIEKTLRETREALQRRKKAVKILLLGQAESGKSTTLKNFLLMSKQDHFSRDQAAWRIVIQLNLIRSVNRILRVLQEEIDAQSSGASWSDSDGQSTELSDEHKRIRMRLSPLHTIEFNLAGKLFPGIHEQRSSEDICVRAGTSWKDILQDATAPKESPYSRLRSADPNRPSSTESRNSDNPTAILAACQDDIIALWEDPIVKRLLRNYDVRPEEQPGFFLNDVKRITATDYVPTEADILRARLRTVGVEEHKLMITDGSGRSVEWYIYDVGGRGMRHYWIPYFDDVDSIIFLAPLAFNQVLDENSKVNKLEDSIQIWRDICSNSLLADTPIILIVNKMDILRDTLAAGVKVSTYVPSYGNAPNDVQHVTKFFRDKFRAYHKRLSPRPRPFIYYETTAIDIQATTTVLRQGSLDIHRIRYEDIDLRPSVQMHIFRAHHEKVNLAYLSSNRP